jgi:hypothetical protein
MLAHGEPVVIPRDAASLRLRAFLPITATSSPSYCTLVASLFLARHSVRSDFCQTRSTP